MEIAREVILDLLPLYLSGEASPATRALIEEYLATDPELARRIRSQLADGLDKAVPPLLPPELEQKSFQRTRKLLGWQRWLFGLGITFTALSLSFQVNFAEGRMVEFSFLFLHSQAFGLFLILGLLCWIGYFLIRSRLGNNVS